MRRLRVFTWHVHGSYLYYLTHAPHDFYLPVRPGRPEGFGGRAGNFPWGDHVHEIPADDVRRRDFDLILFQSRRNWDIDQHELFSPAQRRLPRVYLEHDPPRESPTDTRHIVDDPDVLLVHVTPFNALMWDAGRTPTRVVEHGVTVPDGARYTGDLARGIVVVNDLARRGRRLGHDIFERVRADIPLDLAGMASTALGGLGDLPLADLHARLGRYRFFFNPIRYTSLGLAVCEAMMIGLPILGLATTEMATAVINGVSGFVDTDPARLVAHMRRLLADVEEARFLSDNARRIARQRFGIDRFTADWSRVFADVTGTRTTPVRPSAPPEYRSCHDGRDRDDAAARHVSTPPRPDFSPRDLSPPARPDSPPVSPARDDAAPPRDDASHRSPTRPDAAAHPVASDVPTAAPRRPSSPLPGAPGAGEPNLPRPREPVVPAGDGLNGHPLITDPGARQPVRRSP